MNSLTNGWKSIKLKELCREITVGFVGPMATEYTESGIPFLRSQNILPFRLELSSIKFISPEFHKKLKKSALYPGDVVVVRTGYPGTACVIPPKLPVSNCADLVIFRPSSQLDPHYLTFIFNSALGRSHVAGSLVGVAQQHFNVSVAKEMVVNIPPLPTQRKIVYVLTAYDDLIENNTRRIAILEEMAQSLYREWFVHFRFPGHEKKRLVESELGLIPEGWEVKAIGEILKYHIGGGWGQEEISPEYSQVAYVIRGTDIPSARYGSINSCPLRFHKQSNLETRRLQSKDIVFEVSGGSKGQPVGRALFVSQKLLDMFDEDVICASFCKLLKANEEIMLPELLYLHLLEIYADKRIEKYQVQSTGIINFKFAFFLDSEIVLVPDQKRQERFREICNPLFVSIQNLSVKNANLRQTRDLLLPKLISGEVDVEGLDIHIEGGIYESSREPIPSIS